MQKTLGIDLFRAPSTTPYHELGAKVDDVRGGQGQIVKLTYPNGIPTLVTETINLNPGGSYRYVKAAGTINAGDAVRIDFTASNADNARCNTVIQTSAVDQAVEGIALSAMTSGQYGWILISGFYKGANVATAAAAGDVLGSSATAGRLATATPSAANAYATACGVGARAVTAGSSNTADVILN